MKKRTHILYIAVILVVLGAAGYGHVRVKAESFRRLEDNIVFRRRYRQLLKSVIEGNMELLKTELAAGGARNTSTGRAQSFVRVTDETILAMVWLRYADLLDQLRLPDEKKSDLRDLLVARQKKRFEVINMALSRGFDPSGDLAPLGKLIDEAQGTMDAEIEKLLGDKAAYEFFLEYELTTPQRNTVSALRERLAGSAPLTAEQERKLIEILKAKEKSPEAVPLGRMIYGGVLYNARVTRETLQQAAAVLQPPQLEELEGMLKRS